MDRLRLCSHRQQRCVKKTHNNLLIPLNETTVWWSANKVGYARKAQDRQRKKSLGKALCWPIKNMQVCIPGRLLCKTKLIHTCETLKHCTMLYNLPEK